MLPTCPRLRAGGCHRQGKRLLAGWHTASMCGCRAASCRPLPWPRLVCLHPRLQAFHTLSNNTEKASQVVTQIVNGSSQEQHDFGT